MQFLVLWKSQLNFRRTNMPYVGRVPSSVPVTADDIPANSIDASKIVDGAIAVADVADNAITMAKIADADVVTLKSGRKNLIINGGMSVSQRGDYSTATSMTNGQYGVDRWKSEVKLVTAALTHTDNKIRYTATSTASGRLGPIQWVEFDNRFKGKEFTFSAYVKSNHSNVNLRIDDGVTVQYSSLYTGNATEAVERLSKTFTVASNATQLKLYAKIGSGGDTAMTTGDYIEIYDAQLELGSVATDFEHRSYGEELALCQRFYQALGAHEIGATRGTEGTYSGSENILFPVRLRTTPTLNYNTTYSANGSCIGVYASDVGLKMVGNCGGLQYLVINYITLDAEL